MTPPESDEPASIQHEEAREELYGHGAGGGTGTEVYNILAVIVAVIGAAIAFETIDNWSQWVVLAAIVITVVGFMIAVSPNRRA
jgi:uncharacterized protein (DUF983 family)